MQASIRKIGLLILAVIVLPVLIFSVYEIGSLRQNERVIQEIYRNQLEAILFSINQYSDDILSNLASRIENNLNTSGPITDAELEQLIGEYPAVAGLVLLDNSYQQLIAIPGALSENGLTDAISGSLIQQDSMIRRLKTYLRGGYRKIETLGNGGQPNQFMVSLASVRGETIIQVLLLDPEKFITELLDPKIQEIARGKFQIVAYRAGEDQPFYSSSKQATPVSVTQRSPFWLLYNYQMGIALKELTIADLVSERKKRNLLLIGLIDLILLFGVWLIFRNIRKQVELSHLKSDFVSNVSHEIRTPLALISMYIETLEMGRVKEPGKIREYYAIILNETARLSAMVNRILSFSQIESNRRRYSFSETMLNEVVENAMATFLYTLENKGFNYTFEPFPLPAILADRDALADALVNLVDNAMKYSADQKQIVIRTGLQDHYAYVEVEDHGIGISAKDQRFIFDKFFRVTEKDLANRVKGSGLGLAIVKHIVEAHSGKIFVRSTPGSGSSFRLLFPIK
jgi:two-component system phosphate regulon sensor histidine kinase PhoR